ncbi:MAG: imidazole glycerol phosphate synthase subunit HisH [Bacteroidetes bacterium]|jgi:glutamine amidotransferase|nr:MAG: imidazole glycerol phosphate synthase subunit HisH [Bacteroidota bacterium]RLD94844.1 MAG: imidazole glycerol phosphate synthase subunit HisH [Bacteroidota bacterium]
MKVAIIKYNAGNIRSVDHALKRVGVEALITDDHETILAADRVIFPGVGEAASTMAYLKERELDVLLKGLSCPVLGICLGQQLMCSWSEEGDTACIGIFDQVVRHFPTNGQKVPHMGWNSLERVNGELIPAELSGSYVYFVHSYYVPVCEDTAAECSYILPFSAAMQRDNFYATQFHPEKSGDPGELILKQFLKL